VVEKLRAAWKNKHRRGSFGYAQNRLFDSAQDDGIVEFWRKSVPSGLGCESAVL